MGSCNGRSRAVRLPGFTDFQAHATCVVQPVLPNAAEGVVCLLGTLKGWPVARSLCSLSEGGGGGGGALSTVNSVVPYLCGRPWTICSPHGPTIPPLAPGGGSVTLLLGSPARHIEAEAPVRREGVLGTAGEGGGGVGRGGLHKPNRHGFVENLGSPGRHVPPPREGGYCPPPTPIDPATNSH